MKKKSIYASVFCFIVLLLLPFLNASAAPADRSGQQVDLLFLHDTHSHLNQFLTVENGEDTVSGGFARIKTLIDQAKEKNPDTLVLDAGDFSMGTLVQTIFHSDAPELRMLGFLGCEATTLGNHEFDYRSSGLAGALHAAAAGDDAVPAMVLCNIDWKTMEADGLTEEQALLKDAFDAYGLKDYIVLDKGGVRIAVLGIFGEDALACAPACVLKFRDAPEAAADTVKEIQEKEDVDMIVCVSHAGTSTDADKSEDEILAKAVPDIDVIVSGHSHTTLTEPIRHGNTCIVSCGSYGRNLGSMTLSRQTDGSWTCDSYDILPITQQIPVNAAAQEKIDSFMETVDSAYLSRFDYTRDQVLAQNTCEFSASKELHEIHTEHTLGNLLADSFAYAVENAGDFDGHPVDVAIVPSGCVRDTFARGDITVEDVFNAYSLGIGIDGVPGYPLISMYLTGKELKTGAEIDASVSDFMTAARLYLSGCRFSFNPNRLILNKVTDCCLVDDAGNRVEIEDDKLYRIVCDLYSGQMLGAVADVSYGILSIQPKFADGTPIQNIEDAIITDGGREMKAWAAIAQYLDSLEDTNGDGISDIPESYAAPENRKVVEDSKSLYDLIKQPNKYAVIILLIVLAVFLSVILLVRGILRMVKKIRAK